MIVNFRAKIECGPPPPPPSPPPPPLTFEVEARVPEGSGLATYGTGRVRVAIASRPEQGNGMPWTAFFDLTAAEALRLSVVLADAAQRVA